MNVLAIQQALAREGYDPGPLDGIMGRRTIAAIAAFQSAKKLEIKFPGTVGPITLRALGLTDEPAVPWVTEAERFLGEVETDKRLQRALGLNSAAIPWCGAFVGMVIATVLPHEPLPVNPLYALNWLKFGQSLTTEHFGAIAVFKRTGGGHVGFVVGQDKTYLHILGGNQSNKVSVAKVAKARMVGLQWPRQYPIPTDTLAFSIFTGKVTTNEA